MLLKLIHRKFGIEQENRLVPIAHALMPIIDREFGPDENNAQIAKLVAKEGLATIEGEKSATCDALLYSASLTLWHLGRYDSVPDAALMVRRNFIQRQNRRTFPKSGHE